MITANFFKDKNDMLTGFSITGHAGFADFGYDVCCASVTSAVMMTANTITDVFFLDADVTAEENEVSLRSKNSDEITDKLIMGLLVHLYNLNDEFPGHIKLNVSNG